MPECRSIFILPPSRDELERRLRGRGTDAEDVIRRRLDDAAADMTHWREFDYVVVNDSFERALADLRGVVTGSGEAARRDRPGLPDLAARLTVA
jgi:guanylate kinase